MKEFKHIRDIPKSQRPRERGLELGLENLSDQEILSILIRNGHREHSAIDIGIALLKRFGSILEISRADVEELSQIKGIGKDKALILLASFELTNRMRSPFGKKVLIRSSKDASVILEKNLRGLNKEHFLILMLNTKNYMLGVETISIGSLNFSIVHPRELFSTAIRKSAAAIILAHNHPSGDATPSKEDIDVTQRIKNGGTLLGIDVIDHIIIGEDSYYSFKEEKMM